MLEQQGQVVAAVAGRVSVRLGGRSGCSACDAGRGCGAGVFGKLLRNRPLILEFENHLHARPGQGVVVGVAEAWFLQLVARFYLLPLLAGLGGAAVGHYLSVKMQFDPWARDLAALAGALVAGAAVFRWSRVEAVELGGDSAVHLLRLAERPDRFSDMEN